MDKTKWCKHFKLIEDSDCSDHKNCKGWANNTDGEEWVDDDFKYCPYDGTKKPKGEKSNGQS